MLLLDKMYHIRLPKHDAQILSQHAETVFTGKRPRIGRGYLACWIRRAIIEQAKRENLKLEVLPNVEQRNGQA